MTMSTFDNDFPTDDYVDAHVEDEFVVSNRWTLGSISNRRIRNVVRAIMNATRNLEPWIYHVSKFDSVYLKFKNEKMGSIRIADHAQRNHYKYKWNVRLDASSKSKVWFDGQVMRHMYCANTLEMLFDDLAEHHKELNQEPMDFSNLLITDKVEKAVAKGTESGYNAVVKDLNEKETGEQGMKTKNIAAVLMDNCKTIGVQFESQGKVYTYKTTEDFEVGDKAVVKARGMLQIVDVVEVHKVAQIDVDSNIQYQWIVQKVDMTNYETLNSREQEFNDHLLEVQQKSVVQNAKTMLAESLGVGLDEIQNSVKLLNG